MKKIISTLLFSLTSLVLSAQFVATMESTVPIEGLCKANTIYLLLGYEGQIEATSPVSKEDIFKRLNSEVQFLKDNPKHKEKGLIQIITNCNGEVVHCKVGEKTKSIELYKQIENVFNSIGNWKPGTLNGEEVNSVTLYSFRIKKGQIIFSGKNQDNEK